jgi:hypothetical protein
MRQLLTKLGNLDDELTNLQQLANKLTNTHPPTPWPIVEKVKPPRRKSNQTPASWLSPNEQDAFGEANRNLKEQLGDSLDKPLDPGEMRIVPRLSGAGHDGTVFNYYGDEYMEEN